MALKLTTSPRPPNFTIASVAEKTMIKNSFTTNQIR
jgi:hypothetical protein